MSVNRSKSLSYLGFQRFKPSERLSAFVDCYWFIDSDDRIHSKEYMHPDGGTGIILNYGDTLRFDETPHADTCILDGAITFSRELFLQGKIKAVGIRFKPAGAYLFFSLPLKEIKNETITLADSKLKNHNELFGRLSNAKTFSAKISIIENWLLNAIRSEKNISTTVTESLAFIQAQQGLLSIQSIADKLGYSQRRIERLFNTQVGMTPKEYARTLRIAQARLYIKHPKPKSFADISYDLGFYDQAHFINQFKKVVGITPQGYYLKKH